jgi:hypothetical protein
MDSTRPVSTSGAAAAAARAPIPAESRTTVAKPAAAKAAQAPPVVLKPVGYGLPCAKCRSYYPANVATCPICRSNERVSAKVSAVKTAPAPAAAQPDAGLDEERERFLREFKAQLYASHMQINPSAQLRCSMADEADHSHDPASVCKSCYDRAQERVDLVEAALHMDLREATQIIYDAVWADTSDSTKTYQNAAQALLTELRKRAGVDLVMGPLQRLPH